MMVRIISKGFNERTSAKPPKITGDKLSACFAPLAISYHTLHT